MSSTPTPSFIRHCIPSCLLKARNFYDSLPQSPIRWGKAIGHSCSRHGMDRRDRANKHQPKARSFLDPARNGRGRNDTVPLPCFYHLCSINSPRPMYLDQIANPIFCNLVMSETRVSSQGLRLALLLPVDRDWRHGRWSVRPRVYTYLVDTVVLERSYFRERKSKNAY